MVAWVVEKENEVKEPALIDTHGSDPIAASTPEHALFCRLFPSHSIS